MYVCKCIPVLLQLLFLLPLFMKKHFYTDFVLACSVTIRFTYRDNEQ